ncbi:MAG: prolyl oligopeptidase family serine peptidase [Gemmataceae bacterium]|nr:prolyl oligopeptidase family serine peptidase [Gemmataceae bacterium]
MMLCTATIALLLAAPPQPLTAGDHMRRLEVDKQARSYLIHVPKSYDPKKPTPLVLALHGATMNAEQMIEFSDLSAKADKDGFIVVYPNGTGSSPLLLTWNATGPKGWMGNTTDDVAFLRKVLDDVEMIANIDTKRVYACGLSNGAMMCYRLAAEMSDRIAAIASVSGAVATEDECKPKRAVPVLHFHGTKDPLVPIGGPSLLHARFVKFKSLEDTIHTWIKLNDCPVKPKATDQLSKNGDELKVVRTTYGPGKAGSEVIVVVVEGGGHTWPGQKPPVDWIGKSALNVSANDLIWDFFRKHPLPD